MRQFALCVCFRRGCLLFSLVYLSLSQRRVLRRIIFHLFFFHFCLCFCWYFCCVFFIFFPSLLPAIYPVFILFVQIFPSRFPRVSPIPSFSPSSFSFLIFPYLSSVSFISLVFSCPTSLSPLRDCSFLSSFITFRPESSLLTGSISPSLPPLFFPLPLLPFLCVLSLRHRLYSYSPVALLSMGF